MLVFVAPSIFQSQFTEKGFRLKKTEHSEHNVAIGSVYIMCYYSVFVLFLFV